MDGSFPDLSFGLLRSRRGLLRSPEESLWAEAEAFGIQWELATQRVLIMARTRRMAA